MTATQHEWEMRPVPWPIDSAAAVAALADDGEIAWLDSTADILGPSSDRRASLIACRPVAVLEQFEGISAVARVGGRVVDQDASGWQLWRRVCAQLPRYSPTPIPLTPGWVGYVGFEMARQLERLPASHVNDSGLPVMRMALYDEAIVLDHVRNEAHALVARGVREALGADAARSAPLAEQWSSAVRERSVPSASVSPMVCAAVSRETHEAAVRRALEYIAAGDIYQVNLAHCLRMDGVAPPVPMYARLRRVNPASYGALLRWSGGAIVSVSPELFLRSHAGEVTTRPIKGTRPRTGDPARDEANRRALIASPKEAAELAMIIDLHRNDVGRVCRYGSVRVAQARSVEVHPSVFHTVGEVVGRLRPEYDKLDLLAACFPAGSISGVPKIRALEIIDELESQARGAYTGAIGVWGLDGQMVMNVGIRTLQVRGAAATLYVGGGIVADSDPAAEYEETYAKAAGILRGLDVGPSIPEVNPVR